MTHLPLATDQEDHRERLQYCMHLLDVAMDFIGTLLADADQGQVVAALAIVDAEADQANAEANVDAEAVDAEADQADAEAIVTDANLDAEADQADVWRQIQIIVDAEANEDAVGAEANV